MRRHLMLKAGAAVIGGGMAISMLAASPAMASPAGVGGITTRIVTATGTAPAGDIGDATATCGAGEFLLGGGYAVQGSSTDWRIFVDEPLNNTTWTVQPVNFSSQPLDFTVYAVCGTSMSAKQGVSRYTTDVVQTAVDVPEYQTGEAEAACPAGELRTGGGYDVINISSNWSVYVNAPFRSDIWNVEIDNEVSAATTVHSFAVCLAGTNAKPIRGLSVSTVYTAATAPANSVQTASVSCDPGALMTGGGHDIYSIGPYWSIQASAPTASGNSWRVKVSDLDSYSRKFDSYAVCLL